VFFKSCIVLFYKYIRTVGHHHIMHENVGKVVSTYALLK